MSRKGNCYDNAIIDSFWSTMKLDCLEGKQFHSRQQATVALFECVISFYNRTRRHSSLGYLSPVAFEELNN
jgi:putative transposase